MSVKNITLTLPVGLLKVVDHASAKLYASRSDYIRQALIEQLRTDGFYKPTEDPGQYVRQQSRKRLPTRFIKPSEDDEYAIEAEWFDDDDKI